MAGSDLYAVAGCKIYVGGVLASKASDFVVADFASQVWTLIDGWRTMGSFGDTAALISTDLINRARVIKQKGVTNAGSMQNVFAKLDADPGQIALIAASKDRNNRAFRIDFNDAPPVDSDPVTVTVATPGVITDTAHNLISGDPVVFTTTATLPTGLTAATQYFVKTVIDANSYTVSAIAGGSAIATTGSQSGVHTRTTAPTPSQRLFIGLVMGAQETAGDANTIRNLEATIEINSNIVPIASTQ